MITHPVDAFAMQNNVNHLSFQIIAFQVIGYYPFRYTVGQYGQYAHYATCKPFTLQMSPHPLVSE